MYSLPTVRVVNPNAPDSFMLINESDINDGHVLWDASGNDTPVDEVVFTVARGPRGLWYVKRRDEIASHGFKTEAEAEASMKAQG